MSNLLTIYFSEPLPVFPLPNCVLLPHATIPLHVFEPRYREMTRDTLDERRLIAMATFQGDAWKLNYKGNPPIRDVLCDGCCGRCDLRHNELDDGRYNILLQGVCRAKLIEEVPHDPYRKALLEPIETDAPMEIDMDERRGRLESLLGDPLLQQLASVSAIQNWLSGEIPTAVLVDLAIMTMCDDTESRYAMLCESRAGVRADWLEGLLGQTRRTLRIAERFGSGQSPDGINLN